jgi:amino acid adenylation domain-containing protein
LQTLTARHESLRTTFPKRDGLPVQEIHQRLLPGFETVGAAGVNETELMQRVVQANERPFDLEHGPLLRACVFSVSDSDHVLIVSVHHLVCDAWSLWQFLEELGTCYLQEQGIATPALRPVTARYSDYVRWQRNFLAGPDGERLLAFWKGRLAGELPILNLPTDHPRPAVQNFRGSSVRFQLSASLTSQIKALAMAEGATLYVVLLAAFEILIHRYSGQEEIIVGSPMSGRTQREYADVIGNFINTVALASSSAGDPGFRDFLAKTMRTALDGIAHQDFPFSLLVERMRIPRDPGRTPLFQVLFNFLKPQRFQDVVELWVAGETGQDVQWGGLPLRAMSLPQQEGQFDLTLGMIEGKACLFGDLKYNSDIYDRETVARMARHYEMLLQSIADDPGKSVSALQLLCEPERRKLLVEWNQTQHDFPSDKCVHELFEEQVERTPEAIAVVFEDQRLTYRELDKRANQLARHLQKVGVGPETLVGICVERSLEVVIALLGILKAGGAYVPLDPQYPKERLAFMLEDAQPKVLLIQQRWLKSLPDHPAQVVRLDADWPIISGLAGTRVQKQTTAENLAYVIYTSGSTGRPKGVLLEHRGLCNLVQAQTEEFEIRTDSRVLQFASLNFDASVSEIFTALLVGAVLVVARKESMLPGADLVRLLQEQAVSVVTLPPSVLAVMPSEEFPALRTVISAGEPCTAEIASRWGQGRRFINAYGPTESTVCASLAVCLEGKGRPSIGRPIANTQIYILDRHLQPVPIGVPGELHIGGIGLARGYHNRPELTAEKFIAHPFSTDPGSRIYKTGDLARYLPDGAIEYLGRLDHQVKLRGFRIELGEIESVLSQQADVKSCIVVLREDKAGDKRLVAYYVGVAGLETAPLRERLRARLPEFMVPSAFVALEAFPLNPNGKVDRKALPAPQAPPAASFAAPESKLERSISAIWARELGLEKVGLHDNFFDIGGHSLLLIRIQTLLQQELTVPIAVADMFQYPTVFAMARHLSGGEGGRGRGGSGGRLERFRKNAECRMQNAK